jgi:hypothetical protein
LIDEILNHEPNICCGERAEERFPNKKGKFSPHILPGRATRGKLRMSLSFVNV